MEIFLSRLAKEGVAASTQNQAFNALLFSVKEVKAGPGSARLISPNADAVGSWLAEIPLL